MKNLTKIVLTSLGINTVGAILICIPAATPAGIVALVIGGMGLLFAPLLSMALEESK